MSRLLVLLGLLRTVDISNEIMIPWTTQEIEQFCGAPLATRRTNASLELAACSYEHRQHNCSIANYCSVFLITIRIPEQSQHAAQLSYLNSFTVAG